MSGTRKPHLRRYGREPAHKHSRGSDQRALERVQRDAEHVLQYVRDQEAPTSASEIRGGLELAGRRLSAHRLRQLLALLQARHQLRAVPVPAAGRHPTNPVRPRGRQFYTTPEVTT